MISKSCHFTKPSKQKGVTLIEVLITIVIMAFGLLGVVMMQTISLKSNHEASQRTSANYLLADIVARIRSIPLANPPANPFINIESYDTQSSAIGSSNPSSEPSQCTSVAKCSVSSKISRDLWEWKELLIGTAGLVNANGCIQVTNNQIRVIISWDGIGKSQSSSTTSCGTGDSALKRRSLTIFTIH